MDLKAPWARPWKNEIPLRFFRGRLVVGSSEPTIASSITSREETRPSPPHALPRVAAIAVALALLLAFHRQDSSSSLPGTDSRSSPSSGRRLSLPNLRPRKRPLPPRQPPVLATDAGAPCVAHAHPRSGQELQGRRVRLQLCRHEGHRGRRLARRRPCKRHCNPEVQFSFVFLFQSVRVEPGLVVENLPSASLYPGPRRAFSSRRGVVCRSLRVVA